MTSNRTLATTIQQWRLPPACMCSSSTSSIVTRITLQAFRVQLQTRKTFQVKSSDHVTGKQCLIYSIFFAGAAPSPPRLRRLPFPSHILPPYLRRRPL